jgi:hypothetical protein
MRMTEFTVSLDLTVQPKQYQSMKLGISATIKADEGEVIDTPTIARARDALSTELRNGLREEVAKVYGDAVADYCVNQAPQAEVAPRRAPVSG